MVNSPIDIHRSPTKQRRGSFLDYGGVNSIHNFASLYTRAQGYRGSSLMEDQDDISPNTSPILGSREDAIIDEECLLPPSSRGNHFLSFSFSPTHKSVLSRASEDEPLLTPIKSTSSNATGFGASTAPQTIFNSINTLIGMAMFSLPFGFKLSGWVLATTIFLSSAVVTNYTALCLGRILRRHPELNSYGDIARAYGGLHFLVVVTATFTVDLLGACLSLMVLFADSFHIVLPGVDIRVFKVVLVLIVFVLSLLPLLLLSMLSLVGIFCTMSVLAIIVICGLTSVDSPGSLLVPAATTMWPKNAMDVMLSLGIFMCLWGGHPVFPELYRDMRHPSKYKKCAITSFGTTFVLDYFMGAVGFVMFGMQCDDSIIKTLMNNPSYPRWVRPTLCVLMGILGISKLPLVTRPLITVFETIFKLLPKNGQAHEYTLKRVVGRFVFCLALLCIALMVSSFGKIVSFMGSAVCFAICVTLPLTFYLHFYREDMSLAKAWALRVGITVSVVLAAMGTYSVMVTDI